MKLSDYRLQSTAKSKSATAEDGRLKTEDKTKKGFTLIELLVVISIMGLIGVYTFSNYASFGEDKKLKNAVLDLQSLLKIAQTNAVANAKCNENYSASWQAEFINNQTVNLNCAEPGNDTIFLKKTLALNKISANISIQSITGSPSANCPSALPFITAFELLTGKIKIGSNDLCAAMTVTVKNSKLTAGSDTKLLKVEKGGRIYAQ